MEDIKKEAGELELVQNEANVSEDIIETPEVESDFSDELPEEVIPEQPAEAPAPQAEVPSEEGMLNGVNLYKEEEESKEEEPAEEAPLSEEDSKINAIEEARSKFHKTYKTWNMWKWIGALIGLALILAGWLIPRYTLSAHPTIQLVITLGVAVLALGYLIAYSFIAKKKTEKAMKEYFEKYYAINNDYVFGDKISDLEGRLDAKLEPTSMTDAGLYANVLKVGSRATYTFKYKDHAVIFSDAAASTGQPGDQRARTAFVGKYMVIDNKYEGKDLIVYLKGNKRALPPNNLSAYEMLEDSKAMVLYGEGSESKKIFTNEVRKCLKEFKTNHILIDLAIAIKAGKTYIAMGYEDTLMVLPMDKPFDPKPTIQHKEDMEKIFHLIDVLDETVEAKK